MRLRAANILAVLGPAAAPYADRLADLLEDEASDLYLDGTVRDISRWALTRIGDPRALPGLVERLRAQEEEQGRGFAIGDPRRPNTEDVLMPLRAHADILLPAIRETIRQCGARGGATRSFLPVLEAWGEDALPALPDLIPLLADTWTSVDVLRVMGPAAASAVPAVRTSQVLDSPANHRAVDWTATCLGADRAEVLRLAGEGVMAAKEPGHGPIGDLSEFGRDAAPYADRVRFAMESTTHGPRLTAAITLWEITGGVEPSMRVLEEFVLPIADGGGRDQPGDPGSTTGGAAVGASPVHGRGYPMILQDAELRGLIEEAIACADAGPGETP